MHLAPQIADVNTLKPLPPVKRRNSVNRMARVVVCRALVCALFSLLALPFSLRGQDKLFITEFMADSSGTNGGRILDQNGDASDWLEIYNVQFERAFLSPVHSGAAVSNNKPIPHSDWPDHDNAVSGWFIHENFRLRLPLFARGGQSRGRHSHVLELVDKSALTLAITANASAT